MIFVYGCVSYNFFGKEGGVVFFKVVYRNYIVEVIMFRNGWIFVEERVIEKCVLGKVMS